MPRHDVEELVTAAGRALSAVWGPTQVELLDPIRTGWGRHDVVLCNAAGPPGTPETVVVKAPVDHRSTLFGEWATHRWLAADPRAGGCIVPFHAGDTHVPLIVIGDAGGGPSHARLLQVPGCAASAVAEERRLTATVHGATRGRAAELAAARAALPDGPTPTWGLVSADAVLAELARWEAPVPDAVEIDVRRAVGRLAADEDVACLTFRDACPVNRISTSAGLVAIDLEHAAFGHPAIDAAYPAIGHLACSTRRRADEAIAWPADARTSAEARYREAVTADYPEWTGDRFLDDLAAATLVWLATILHRHRERTVPDERRSPARLTARARVVEVLDAVQLVAARTDGITATSGWAAAVARRCVERWGEVEPLPTQAGWSAPARGS